MKIDRAEFSRMTVASQMDNCRDLLKERMEALMLQYDLPPKAIAEIIDIACDLYAQGMQAGTTYALDMLDIMKREL